MPTKQQLIFIKYQLKSILILHNLLDHYRTDVGEYYCPKGDDPKVSADHNEGLINRTDGSCEEQSVEEPHIHGIVT